MNSWADGARLIFHPFLGVQLHLRFGVSVNEAQVRGLIAVAVEVCGVLRKHRGEIAARGCGKEIRMCETFPHP